MKRNNESGRSMVEMLAVLIIFIILSILGIVGFDFMKERQYANDLMKAAVNVYNIARTKGRNTTTDIEKIQVPKGVGRMDANVSRRTVTVYRDRQIVNRGVIRAIESLYGNDVTEETIDETIDGSTRSYSIIKIQF